MPSYQFQIKLVDRVLHSLDNVSLTDPAEAWDVIAELANQFPTPGHRVLVKDEHGNVVIMAGLIDTSASESKTAA
jgi:hypothetical protein